MTTIPQHISQPLDNQEPSPEEKPQASLTAQSVTQRPIWEVIVEIGEQIPMRNGQKCPPMPLSTTNTIFREALAHDEHFQQAGFVPLLRDN